MKALAQRAAYLPGLAFVMVLGFVSAAGATTVPDANTVVGSAASDLKDQLLTIAGTVLPYAAAILAMTIGWRLARRFVRA